MSEYESRIEELFEAALDLPPEDRDAYLAKACGGDVALAAAVRELVESEASVPEGFLAGQDTQAFTESSDIGDRGLPDRIGEFEIMRLIGEGGMGVIYEARQASPSRHVALKVIRSQLLSRETVRRFRHEADVLGSLQHAGIAQIYESGFAVVDGKKRPYLAMELIDGQHIDTFVKERRLSAPAIIEMVARICDAVHHAHQKGVIHRDLKPSNILAREVGAAHGGAHTDESGVQPKVLDFGVARVIDADMQTVTMQTQVGQLVGTIAYMSPEQFESNTRDIDTRSDVYGLGVILFELLAGRLPYDLTGITLTEAVRTIRDDDPLRLAALQPALAGDVETIVRKAMAKEKDRRYGSATELAADLRRYLRDEPIEARPASTLYNLTKFAKRNRVAISGIVATAMALVIGLVFSLLGFLAASRESDARKLALEDSYEVTRFFTDLLGQATPEALGRDVTVREVLDAAAGNIDIQFDGRPQLEGRIRSTLGMTYLSLGEFERSEQQLENARLLLETHSPDDGELLKIKLAQGMRHFYAHEYEAALNIFDQLVHELQGRSIDEVDLGEVITVRAFAATRLGRFEEAATDFERGLAMLREQYGVRSPHMLAAQSRYAEFLRRTGAENIEQYYRDLIAASEEIRGGDHSETILQKGNLAVYLQERRRFDEALSLLRETLDSQTRVLGAEHRQTLISASNLGRCMASAGRADEGRALVERALETSTEAHGEESASNRFLLFALGTILRKSSDIEAADEVLKRSAASCKKAEGELSEGALASERELLNHYIATGRSSLGLPLGKAMLERASEKLEAGDPWLYRIRYDLARVYLNLEEYDEAEPLLLQAAEDANSDWMPPIRRRLVYLYTKSNRPNEAAKWGAVPNP